MLLTTSTRFKQTKKGELYDKGVKTIRSDPG